MWAMMQKFLVTHAAAAAAAAGDGSDGVCGSSKIFSEAMQELVNSSILMTTPYQCAHVTDAQSQ
jgi:hypothetical protein